MDKKDKIKTAVWTTIGFGVLIFSMISLAFSSRAKLQQTMEKHNETINIYQEQITQQETEIKELEKKIKQLEKDLKAKKEVKAIPAVSTNVASAGESWIWSTVTAYCPCLKCCGKTNGITASGKKAKANHTIATSSKYKFGTKIEIAGYGVYTVEDRGGAIQGDRIDIFFNTHEEALKFGRRTLKFRVV